MYIYYIYIYTEYSVYVEVELQAGKIYDVVFMARANGLGIYTHLFRAPPVIAANSRGGSRREYNIPTVAEGMGGQVPLRAARDDRRRADVRERISIVYTYYMLVCVRVCV